MAERIRAFQGDVVYTRDTHGGKLPGDPGGQAPAGGPLRQGDPRAGKFTPDPKSREGKTVAVIDKPTFGSVELGDFAASGGYDAIELVGLCTDICVISNALCLKSRLWETPITVWADCCAGVTPESHTNALSAMKMCQINVG